MSTSVSKGKEDTADGKGITVDGKGETVKAW